MQCPQCEHNNREQAKFCEGRGSRLVAKCAECGTELGPSARFCSECGTPVAAVPSAAPSSASQPTGRFSSPQSYTPQHLAERIVGSRGALEGERKQVTVLFADLKGSMELLADRDPEEARAILDPVLERMMDAVHRYEGTVNQVMGDGIMALFGAPLAHEDHAVRACYAALRMQETVKQYAAEIRSTVGLPIQIRIGLNSGEVVVRSITNDLRTDYTAVGQNTHLAARMEQVAAPGTILMAPETLQLAEGYVEVKGLGPTAVKGPSEPIEVYELVGTGMARSRLQATVARGLTKFVGREAEIETLRRTLDQAGTGHGQVVALVGEPGVGKSRLVWEFSHSHRTHGWLVLDGGSVSYGRATSYLPVIDLLKSYCGIEARDDPRHVREKLTGKLLTLDPALQPTLPALLALLDVPVDDAPWQALDPQQRRQRTLDACKRLLLRESQEQPLLLIFEDLHWIDAGTQALLDSLLESLPTARTLLLVNYRPEYEHTWHRKTYYQQLRLDPLPPENAEELLLALLGDVAELQPLRRILIDRTEGNPFFVEESVRTLVESGVLAGERGSYRLAKLFESTHVPATVQAVLAARIDRLAPEDKRLLQSASVIGKDVAYPLLAAIADLSEDALSRILARLQAAEFLYETSLFPDLEYTFKHALTHEVVYGSLLHERRRALHRQIIEAIERLRGDRLAEQVERLAHHAFRGEVWDRAVSYLRQGGSKALARSAHREAAELFEQALEALTHLPESRATLELAIDLRFDLYSALLTLARFPRILAVLHEVEPLAEALGDPLRLARLHAFTTYCYRTVADHRRCMESAERALAFAAPLQEDMLKAEVNFSMGLASFDLGNYRAAIEYFRRSAAQTPDCQIRIFSSLFSASVVSLTWLASCYAELGEFAEGFACIVACSEEINRMAEGGEQPWELIGVWISEGRLYARRGDFTRGIPSAERALSLCESAGIAYLYTPAATLLGFLYALAGRFTEAIPLLEQAVERGAGRANGESRRLFHLAEGYRLAGERAQTESVAGRALAMARERQEHGCEALVLRLLGEVAAHADHPDVVRAEAYYREALALAKEIEMCPLVADCHLGLGTLYQQIGREQQAQAELTTAIEMYGSMEMTFWSERAETALAQVAN